MKRRTGKLVILFLFVINFSYAEEWRTETHVPVMDELKDVYHVDSYIASRNYIHAYAAITDDVMLFGVNKVGLVLYDFKQGTKTIIPSHLDFWEAGIYYISYDEKNNTVHVITTEGLPRSHFYYYVVSLDTYLWDKIEELSFPNLETSMTHYDSLEERIYCVENGSLDMIEFDLRARKIIERIKIFEGRYYRIEAIYGSPVCVLGKLRNETDNDVRDYFIYDFQRRTAEVFQNPVLGRGIKSFFDYVPLGPYRFLCTQTSKIVEIDLFNDTYRTVAFDTFHYSLMMLKRKRGSLMNFIVVENIGRIFTVHRFIFCSWEYPDSWDAVAPGMIFEVTDVSAAVPR
jgi:hypothetical protein